VAPLATVLATVLGTALGLVTGYFGGAVDNILSRFIDAFLALPIIIIGMLAIVALGPSMGTVIIVIGVVFAPFIARTVRASVLQEREMKYVSGGAAAQRANLVHHVRGDPAQRDGAGNGAVHGPAELRDLHGRHAELPRFRHPATVTRLGAAGFEHYGLISGGYWWPVLFPALAIASLVIGVNMMADGIAKAFER
jgi:peptide/nickel transport system permease protein